MEQETRTCTSDDEYPSEPPPHEPLNEHLTLSEDHDPIGHAIKDYYTHGHADNIQFFSSHFDEDEIVTAFLFRSFEEMSRLEQNAIELSQGKILDVEAKAGCRSLILQNRGFSVTAIDRSKLAVEIMTQRGLKNVLQKNILDPSFTGSFDTLLLLRNGIGLVGELANLPFFFERINQLLSPTGFVLLDSRDLNYLYEEEIEWVGDDPDRPYYGEVDIEMKYKKIKSELFNWLYVDQQTLTYQANQAGFQVELVAENMPYDYLAKISRFK